MTSPDTFAQEEVTGTKEGKIKQWWFPSDHSRDPSPKLEPKIISQTQELHDSVHAQQHSLCRLERWHGSCWMASFLSFPNQGPRGPILPIRKALAQPSHTSIVSWKLLKSFLHHRNLIPWDFKLFPFLALNSVFLSHTSKTLQLKLEFLWLDRSSGPYTLCDPGRIIPGIRGSLPSSASPSADYRLSLPWKALGVTANHGNSCYNHPRFPDKKT